MTWIIDPSTQVELWVPLYATPGRAIRREARRREGELRTLRLHPDLGSDWPIWDEDALVIDTVIGQLSCKLRQDLQRWNQVWLHEFHHFRGWSSARVGEQWHAEGAELTSRLQEETWEIADVVPMFEMYPVDRPDDGR